MINCLIYIENFDILQPIEGDGVIEQRITDFVDHLILRTFDDVRMRTHFPIIIESSNNRYYNRDIYNDLHIRDDVSYPAVELYGYFKDNIF